MDPLAVAATGIRSAEVRLAASAHNVANLNTPSFRPLRVHQSALEGGGSVARAQQAPLPEDVDLAREFVAQIQASLQLRGSLRVFAAATETRGSLLDLLA
jgi:flagellar basal body rod protein FlgG